MKACKTSRPRREKGSGARLAAPARRALARDALVLVVARGAVLARRRGAVVHAVVAGALGPAPGAVAKAAELVEHVDAGAWGRAGKGELGRAAAAAAAAGGAEARQARGSAAAPALVVSAPPHHKAGSACGLQCGSYFHN